MIKDNNGAYTDCFMYPSVNAKHECRLLKGWYNEGTTNRCKGCPFFKTREQAEKDKLKYPMTTEEYKQMQKQKE